MQQASNRVRVGPFDLNDDLSPDEWVARRNAQVAQKGRAELAGRKAWTDSIRTGKSVEASQPSHVMALGMRALGGQPEEPNAGHGYNPNEPRDERGRWTTGGAGTSQQRTGLDRNPLARAIVGDVARGTGLAPGVARGAWHTAEDIGQGLGFIGRIANPYDAKLSSHGSSALDALARAAEGVVGYTANAIPVRILRLITQLSQ